MSAPPFHHTLLGHRFYERQLPELIRQLTRLNDLLERGLAAFEARRGEGSGRR
jgi:hypothetical protein